MPRYVVERTFPERTAHPGGATRALAVCLERRRANDRTRASPGCTRTSARDREKTFCVYDAPEPRGDPEARRLRNTLPVDRITQVSVLDPYFYR